MQFSAVDIKTFSTDKDTHFTTGINQNATDNEDITVTDMGDQVWLTEIKCQSDQQLFWRLWFSESTDRNSTTDLDADKIKNHVDFDMVADGERFGAANQYRLTKIIWPLYRYVTLVANTVYLTLENKSATAKNAGATGEIRFDFSYVSEVRF